MRNLVGKKEEGTKFWCHGSRREACREREEVRKEDSMPKFMILSIQRCNIKSSIFKVLHIVSSASPKIGFVCQQ